MIITLYYDILQIKIIISEGVLEHNYQTLCFNYITSFHQIVCWFWTTIASDRVPPETMV